MKGGPGTPDEGPASPGGERTHEGPPKVLVRHKQSDRGLWFRHSSGAPELRSSGARKRESRESETGGEGGRGGAEGWRKGRVKMGRAVSVIAERRR